MKSAIRFSLYLLPAIVVLVFFRSQALIQLIAIYSIFSIGSDTKNTLGVRLQDPRFSRDIIVASLVLGYLWLAVFIAFAELPNRSATLTDTLLALDFAIAVASITSAFARLRCWLRRRESKAAR